MGEKPPGFLELIGHLLSGIRAIVTAIQNQEKGIAPETSTSQKTTTEQDGIPRFVRAEVHIVKGVEVYKNSTEASDDRAYQSKTLRVSWFSFWVSLATLISLIAYAFITHSQLSAMIVANHINRKALELSNRPWIAFDVPEDRGGVTIESGFAHQDQGNGILRYWLINVGHSPASVQIVGDWAQDTENERDFMANKANEKCEAGKKDFAAQMDVIPGTPTVYGIHYDDEKSVSGAPHLRAIKILPGIENYVHIGCIVYRSTTGDNSLHQTPFVAYLNLRPDAAKKEEKLTGPWVIGTPD